MPRHGLGSVVAIAVLAALLMAQPAMAASVNDIFNDYQKSGSIDPCRYSSNDLQRAGSQLPSDVEQYSPSFVDQLNAARGRQCGGAGGGSGQSLPAGVSVSGGGGSGGAGGDVSPGKVTKPPSPVRPRRVALENVPAPPVSAAAAASGTSAGKPDSIVVLLMIAAVLVLIGAFVARRLGFHPIQKIRGTGPPQPGPSGQ